MIATAVSLVRNWKTSEIARDPVLGDDVFFYLTQHSKDLQSLQRDMEQLVRHLQSAGVTVLREKIEVIIHDIRY